MCAREQCLPPIARIAWQAEGDYDLNGVKGEPGVTARFVLKLRLGRGWRVTSTLQPGGACWVAGAKGSSGALAGRASDSSLGVQAMYALPAATCLPLTGLHLPGAGIRSPRRPWCRFQRISLRDTVDGEMSQEDLNGIAQQVERRCIVAATIHASGEATGGPRAQQYLGTQYVSTLQLTAKVGQVTVAFARGQQQLA